MFRWASEGPQSTFTTFTKVDNVRLIETNLSPHHLYLQSPPTLARPLCISSLSSSSSSSFTAVSLSPSGGAWGGGSQSSAAETKERPRNSFRVLMESRESLDEGEEGGGEEEGAEKGQTTLSY